MCGIMDSRVSSSSGPRFQYNINCICIYIQNCSHPEDICLAQLPSYPDEEVDRPQGHAICREHTHCTHCTYIAHTCIYDRYRPPSNRPHPETIDAQIARKTQKQRSSRSISYGSISYGVAPSRTARGRVECGNQVQGSNDVGEVDSRLR